MRESRVDLYSEPHKGLRNQMFEVSILCAGTNFIDAASVKLLADRTNAMIAKLKKHSWHEDTYAHPILGAKIPSSRAKLEREHDEHNKELENLGALNAMLTTPMSDDKLQRVGLEFYRALNRFIAHYLHHLDEEEYGMQNLWELCEPAELFAIMFAFAAHEEPDFLPILLNQAEQQLSQKEMMRIHQIIFERLGADKFEHTLSQAATISPAQAIDEIRAQII
jgi:hypothetical protein